jgi:hypothetical protein
MIFMYVTYTMEFPLNDPDPQAIQITLPHIVWMIEGLLYAQNWVQYLLNFKILIDHETEYIIQTPFQNLCKTEWK